MTLKEKGPIDRGPEDLGLSGDILGLKTTLQELVKEKERTGSDTTKRILRGLDDIRVTGIKPTLYPQTEIVLKSFQLDIYELEPTVEVTDIGLALGGMPIVINMYKGKPPEETESTLRNKIEFVKALE